MRERILGKLNVQTRHTVRDVKSIPDWWKNKWGVERGEAIPTERAHTVGWQAGAAARGEPEKVSNLWRTEQAEALVGGGWELEPVSKEGSQCCTRQHAIGILSFLPSRH